MITTKGLQLNDLGIGDIVTVQAAGAGDRSYNDAIFEITALTSAAAVLVVRWSGFSLRPPGTKIVIRRREWSFFEASDLLDAIEEV